MFGLFRTGPNFYVAKKGTIEELQAYAKEKRHTLEGAVSDEMEWLVRKAAERQTEVRGGTVMPDGK